MQHTGRFQVKFRMQSRQIRGKHEDTNYVLKQITYLKEFAVKWSSYALFFWEDDKAIVPVGEPGQPVGTGVRAQNRSLVPSAGAIKLSAFDHDFHVAGCIPTAVLKTNIPERASDTFFQGDAYVIVKDKIFQPSHGLRHGAELTSLVREYYSEDGVSASMPVLLELTDGGPDHRTTYGSVQVLQIIYYINLTNY